MRSTTLVAVVVVALVLAGCSAGIGDETATEAPDEPTDLEEAVETETGTGTDADGGDDAPGELEVHYVDVGQGDAALVRFPNGETMLVDSGDWRDEGSTVLAYLEERGVDRIDHLVTTHGHADHIGGHAAVIERYETEADGVGAVYDPGVAADTATYERYLDAIETHDVTLFGVDANDTLPVGNATVEFHNPPGEPTSDDIDENSLAFTIEHGETTVLFTGDAGEAAERRMLESDTDLAADVYQAGHHGSSTSSTDPFVAEVDPAVAVISSAYDSRYGHPHEEVLERLAAADVETYWTGTHGTVRVTSDGERLTIATQTAATTDAAALRSEPESTAGPTDPLEERSTVRPALGGPPTTALVTGPASALALATDPGLASESAVGPARAPPARGGA